MCTVTTRDIFWSIPVFQTYKSEILTIFVKRRDHGFTILIDRILVKYCQPATKASINVLFLSLLAPIAHALNSFHDQSHTCIRSEFLTYLGINYPLKSSRFQSLNFFLFKIIFTLRLNRPEM